MDQIESINEAVTMKDVMAAVQGKENEQERAKILNDIAWKENLPGLYDPVSGYYVRKQSMPTDGQTWSIAASAAKDDDAKLASLGLVPKNAKTSSALGRLFGASGDMYDKGVQASNAEAVAKQEAKEQALAMLKQLGELVTKYAALKAKKAGAGATQTATAESIKVDISSALVESFGYQTEGVGTTLAKAGGKTLGKALPGVGLAFGAADAYDRAKKGDWLGAGIAGLSGVTSLVPGIGTAATLGLDAINVGRDLAKGGDEEGGEAPAQGQAAKPAGNAQLIALQKKIGATPDGIMGPDTKAKLQAWQKQNGLNPDGIPGPQTYAKAGIKESGESMKQLTVAESIASLRDRLALIESTCEECGHNPCECSTEESMDEDVFEFVMDEDGNAFDTDGQPITDEGVLSNLAKGAWNVGKNVVRGFKGQAARSAAGKFTKAGGATKLGQGAKAAANFAAKNPVKGAAIAGAAGLGTGLAMGSTGSGGASGSAGASSAGQGGKPPKPAGQAGASATPTEPTAPTVDPIDTEMAELKKQIDAVMAELGKSADPEIQKALGDLKAQVN
jgi:peptidoglycan hydrolase-like protein with peptidoglycan-binding domain